MNNEEDKGQEEEALFGRAPENDIDPAKIGPSDPKDPAEGDTGEVGGRDVVKYAMKCYKCNTTSWIDYDTENYKAYRCSPCGAVNVL